MEGLINPNTKLRNFAKKCNVVYTVQITREMKKVDKKIYKHHTSPYYEQAVLV